MDPASDPSRFSPADYWERRFRSGPTLSTTGFLGMGETFNRWLYRGYATALTLTLKRYRLSLGRKERVIDAGAGSGFLEDFCRKRGVVDLLGFDLTDAAIRHLSGRCPDYRFEQQDLTLPLRSTPPPADVVFCISVLYHVVTPEGLARAIGNLAHLTKEGGHLILADNFLPFEIPHDEGSHQRHWSKAHLESLLRDHGFTLIGYQPIFFTLNRPIRWMHRPVGRLYLRFWDFVSAQIAGNERRGAVVAPVSFAKDWLLQRLCRAGPSAHYLVCRRTGVPAPKPEA